MCILTRDQVELMDRQQAEQRLKTVYTQYPPSMLITKDIMPVLDPVVNTILYLEDRIQYFRMMDVVHMANQARWPSSLDGEALEEPNLESELDSEEE
jgi:hypothetical protein